MDLYDGPGEIRGGGSYVYENGVGGEVYNFKPSRGKCYGYAMSLHAAGINLRHLVPDRKWERGDELSGVDVVFLARHKELGQVVVGWYRNATVFHKQYRARRGKIAGMDGESRHFVCYADQQNVTLLPEEQRTFTVPYAPVKAPGFPGQSNVWYPLRQPNPDVVQWVKSVRKLIARTPAGPMSDKKHGGGKGGKKWGKPDTAMNARVEMAAVDAVTRYYKARKYTVESVEKENLGWDLEVRHGKVAHKIEVKGVSSDSIFFELTPNEYRMLSTHAATYRVCVVCGALENPFIYHFIPRAKGKLWQLHDTENGVLIALEPRIAAIGRDTGQSPS